MYENCTNLLSRLQLDAGMDTTAKGKKIKLVLKTNKHQMIFILFTQKQLTYLLHS